MSESKRIDVIDAIRGFALMGLFLVHMVEYFELYWYSPEPGWVHDWVFGLFAGKAYALFALMFGVSFYILLEAPDSKASLNPGRYAWRMILLWLFGYMHSLIYPGDILQVLAVGGLLILLFYRLSSKILLFLSCIFLLQIPFFIQYAILLEDAQYTQPKFWSAFGANFEVFANADFLNLIQHNVWSGQFPKWILNYETGAVWNFLGLFFMGIVLARHQIFGKRISSIRLTLLACMFGGMSIITIWIRNHYAHDLEPMMHRWVFEEGLTRISRFLVIGIYMSAGIVFYRLSIGQRILKPLVACGRASLSLYVLQSIIFVPLFYGFGLGWYESIGQERALALGVIAWVLQVLLANWWLNRARYAPLEAAWRYLTKLRIGKQFPGKNVF